MMELLGYPAKSPLDYNDYKLVKLPNGFRALLICNHIARDEDGKWIGSLECIDDQIKRFNRNTFSFSSYGCSDDKTQEQSCKENSENRNKKKKCPFSHGDMAKVVLTVDAGSFSDPDCAPGLAHLLEHMVYLGSKKYPARDAFDSFLTKHGGQSNAMTFEDSTSFMFSVHNEHLAEALDMLVHLMMNPIMNSEDAEVETEIIDDEFNENAKMNHEARRYRILQLTAKEGHPVRKFIQGNNASLSRVDKTGRTLHSRLTEFHEKFYHAEYMTMAIQAGHHIDVLEEIVRRTCSQIPRKGAPTPVPLNELYPFDTPEFRKCYKVIPIEDQDYMYVSWELPAAAGQNYATKSLDYIARLIQHSSSRSLNYWLKAMGWITDLQVIPDRQSACSSNYSCVLTIGFVLTDDGLANRDSVLKLLFVFLRIALTKEPCGWFFKELQDIYSMQFHFKPAEAEEQVLALAQRIRSCRPMDLVWSEALIQEWDPDSIMEYLKMMIPERANFMIFSKSFEDCWKQEQYFEIKYGVEDIPKEFIQTLKRAQLSNQLVLEVPCANRFVATDFKKLKHVVESSKPEDIPVCVFMKNRVEFWNNVEFDEGAIPQTSYRILLASTIQLRNPLSTALLDVLVQLINSNLAPHVQLGEEALLQLEIKSTIHGIDIETSGITHKLETFLSEALECIIDIQEEMDNDKFEIYKEVQLKEYVARMMKPETTVDELKEYISIPSRWMSCHLYEALLKDGDFETFQAYCNEFMESIYILGLADGNATKARTKEFANGVMNQFKLDPYMTPPYPDIIVNLPIQGDSILRIRGFNPKDNSAAIVNSYFIGEINMRELCISYMLADLLFEPAFQYLRIEHNLGYDVQVNTQFAHSTVEFYIAVRTHSDKLKGSYIKEKMDDFVRQFYNKNISGLTQDQFEYMLFGRGWNTVEFFRKSLWHEILSGELMFERDFIQVTTTYDLKASEIQQFYEMYLLPPTCKFSKSKMRKFSLQVVGPSDKEYPKEFTEHLNSWPDIPAQYTSRLIQENKAPGEDVFPLISMRAKKTNQGEHIVNDFERFKSTKCVIPRRARTVTTV